MEILSTSVTFKIDPSHKTFLEKQAKVERRNLSSLVRNVIQDYCQREQAKSKPSS